jgi:hypothetical protein
MKTAAENLAAVDLQLHIEFRDTGREINLHHMGSNI